MNELNENIILNDRVDNTPIRIVYINEEKDAAVLIRLDESAEMPFWQTVTELKREISAGELSFASEDVYAKFDAGYPETLTERQQSMVEKLLPVFQGLEKAKPSCFLSDGRRSCIRTLMRVTGKSQSSCRRLFHNYWARGGGYAALIPQYNKRGRKPSVKGESCHD